MEHNILPTHRFVWSLLFAHLVDEEESQWKKWTAKLFPLFSFVSHLSLMAASAVYVIEFISTDLEVSLHAFGQVVCYFPWIFLVPIGFTHPHKIIAVFDKLIEIHTKYQNMDSYEHMSHANQIGELLWHYYFKFMLYSFNSTIAFMISSIYLCWLLHGNFDVKYLYRPFKVILPWDIRTPIGYIGEVIFHIITGQMFLFCTGVVLLLFIAMCLHHKAFYQMYCHSLHKFECVVKKQNHAKNLCELIRFHASVKGWMLDSAEAYSYFMLVQLIFVTVSIGLIFFLIDLQVQHFGFDILIILIGFLVCTSSPFVYCYYGKITTDCYANMADRLFEIDWQQLPIGIQKYFIVMIGNMQRPLYYHGFEFIVLNLETFQKIFRKVITFYMMFKTFTSQ